MYKDTPKQSDCQNVNRNNVMISTSFTYYLLSDVMYKMSDLAGGRGLV